MAKFNIGDRVRHKDGIPFFGIKPGASGTVEESALPQEGLVSVMFDDLFDSKAMNKTNLAFKHLIVVKESELTAAEDGKAGTDFKVSRHVVIDVSDDGARAKCIDGKKVTKEASVKRHPSDEPNGPLAVLYVIRKLFPHTFAEFAKACVEETGKKKEPDKPIRGFIRITNKVTGDSGLVNVASIVQVCGSTIWISEDEYIECKESHDEIVEKISEASA